MKKDEKAESPVWFGLTLITEYNKTTVNYLDKTLNLLDGTYKPYQKVETSLQYIHEESNRTPNIIKQIPITIETHLSNQSPNKKIFLHAEEDYENILIDKSEYKQYNKWKRKNDLKKCLINGECPNQEYYLSSQFELK